MKVLKHENYEVKRPLPIEKNKEKIGLMKDELGGKTSKYCVVLRSKVYGFIADGRCVDKKAKGTKDCVIKREIKFQDFKTCLENGKNYSNLNKGSGVKHKMY